MTETAVAVKAPTRQEQKDELFKGKKYTILKEVHLEGDERFQTPFGNKGRHGYVLEEVGNTSNRFIVGASMLTQIAAEYGAVTVPVKDRKRRTKEQKAADDAAAAAAKAAAPVVGDALGAETVPAE
jgi:hypothetical protein